MSYGLYFLFFDAIYEWAGTTLLVSSDFLWTFVSKLLINPVINIEIKILLTFLVLFKILIISRGN